MPNSYDDLIGDLEKLQGKPREDAERRSLRKVGKVFKDAIVERAPVRADTPSGTALPPGAVKADIHTYVTMAKNPVADASRVRIGPGKTTAHAVDWVENGHVNVHGGYSRLTRKGGRRGPGKISKRSPNTPAHPFVRPAADAVEEQAVQIYADAMSAEIDQVMNG